MQLKKDHVESCLKSCQLGKCLSYATWKITSAICLVSGKCTNSFCSSWQCVNKLIILLKLFLTHLHKDISLVEIRVYCMYCSLNTHSSLHKIILDAGLCTWVYWNGDPSLDYKCGLGIQNCCFLWSRNGSICKYFVLNSLKKLSFQAKTLWYRAAGLIPARGPSVAFFATVSEQV
jgi:hypothetical protein